MSTGKSWSAIEIYSHRFFPISWTRLFVWQSINSASKTYSQFINFQLINWKPHENYFWNHISSTFHKVLHSVFFHSRYIPFFTFLFICIFLWVTMNGIQHISSTLLTIKCNRISNGKKSVDWKRCKKIHVELCKRLSHSIEREMTANIWELSMSIIQYLNVQ